MPGSRGGVESGAVKGSELVALRRKRDREEAQLLCGGAEDGGAERAEEL